MVKNCCNDICYVSPSRISLQYILMAVGHLRAAVEVLFQEKFTGLEFVVTMISRMLAWNHMEKDNFKICIRFISRSGSVLDKLTADSREVLCRELKGLEGRSSSSSVDQRSIIEAFIGWRKTNWASK